MTTDITTSQAVLNGAPKPFGKRIGQKPLGNYPPPMMLTLMVISLDGPRLRFRTYQTQLLDKLLVETAEESLVEQALADKPAPGVVEVSQDPDGLLFRQASYFTIVLDPAGWDFCEGTQFPALDPFIFYDDATAKFDPNNSFFEARTFDLRGRRAVRCINYFRKGDGEDEIGKDETSVLGFKIYINVPLATQFAAERRTVIIIDPTAENRGPNG